MDHRDQMLRVSSILREMIRSHDILYAVITYETKTTGRIARYPVMLGAEVIPLYKQDIMILADMLGRTQGIEYEAVHSMLKSRIDSLSYGVGDNPRYTQSGMWVSQADVPGIKYHTVTGEMYLSGILNGEVVVLVKGDPGREPKGPLAKAKHEIQKHLPSSKYRTFALTNITKLEIDGKTVMIDTTEARDE